MVRVNGSKNKVPTLMHGREIFMLLGSDSLKRNALELDNMRSIVVIRRINRLKKEDVRIYGLRKSLER